MNGISWHKACVLAAKQVSWMFIFYIPTSLSFKYRTPPPPPPPPYGTCCHVPSITYTVLDGFFPYLAHLMITSMRGCVARNDLWPWPISPRSFSCDVAYFMDYIHLWHKYNPWGVVLGIRLKKKIGSDNRNMWKDYHISHHLQYKHINTTIKQLSLCLELTIILIYHSYYDKWVIPYS